MPRASKAGRESGLKRSITRRFNDALSGTGGRTLKTVDKRVERRLTRYREELKKGIARGKILTPLDIAMRVHELLENGAKLGELRKIVKPINVEYDTETMAGLLEEMHPVYGYRADAYRFAGVDDETLLAAGIIDSIPKKRGPKAGSSKKSKGRKKK